MKKRILSTILTAFILCIVLPGAAAAEDAAVSPAPGRMLPPGEFVWPTSGRTADITVDFDDVGMAWIRHGDKFGFIDKTGELVIPMIFDAFNVTATDVYSLMNDFAEGLAGVSVDGFAGFIDKTGEFVIPPTTFCGDFWIGEWASYMPRFNNGLARVRYGGKFGYIDRYGNIAVPFEFDWAGNQEGFFSEGLIRVRQDDRWGFIDTSGNVVVPIEYADVRNFSNGLAAVTHGGGIWGNWGFIDRTGRIVIPLEFDIGDQWSGYSSFNEYGLAVVRANRWTEYERHGVIDRTGRWSCLMNTSEYGFCPAALYTAGRTAWLVWSWPEQTTYGSAWIGRPASALRRGRMTQPLHCFSCA